jgi:hypothetical protein
MIIGKNNIRKPMNSKNRKEKTRIIPHNGEIPLLDSQLTAGRITVLIMMAEKNINIT